MISVFQCESYVEYINKIFELDRAISPRGQIKKLAAALKCHPTFISQVTRSKSEFNHEQALRFCTHYGLSEDETAYFLDLVNRDRAGNPQARQYFEQQLKKRQRDRNSLQKRAQLDSGLATANEMLYFQSLLPSLVHAALQLPRHDTPPALSQKLRVPVNQIHKALGLLKELGLVQTKNQRWKTTQRTLHVGKDSPLNQHYHSNWRLKTAALLMEGRRTPRHTHFSSVFSVSRKEAENIRDALLDILQKTRQEMIQSDPEELYAFCLDFFPAA